MPALTNASPRLSPLTFKYLLRILCLPRSYLSPHLLSLVLLPAATILYLYVSYYLILSPGQLYNALITPDFDLFCSALKSLLFLASLNVILRTLRGFLRDHLSNHIRLQLTNSFHQLYFSSSSFLSLSSNPHIDNPDQRVSLDLRLLSSSLLYLIFGSPSNSGGLFEGCLSIFWYSYQVYLRTALPGIIIAYVWSTIVAILSIRIVNLTAPVLFKQERLEADFRFRHADVRKRAQPLAFLRGAQFEQRVANSGLLHVIRNMNDVIVRNALFNAVNYSFSYYISAVMYSSMAIAVATGHVGGGTGGERAQWISQTGGVFIQLLYSFTMLIELGSPISDLVTNTHRVGAMLDELEQIRTTSSVQAPGQDTPLLKPSNVDSSQQNGIIVDNLVVQLDEHITIGPVSFRLQPNQWLLLEGPSGSGKTTILRVLRGLQTPTSGTVRMPREHEVMFLPQIVYIPHGEYSLRELVVFPDECSGDDREKDLVVNALEIIGWRRGDVRNMVDAREPWGQKLSPGEMELLMIARVVCRRPAFVVMDEPTASLDVESEERVMMALKKIGVAALIVGHRDTLRKFHDEKVTIKPGMHRKDQA